MIRRNDEQEKLAGKNHAFVRAAGLVLKITGNSLVLPWHSLGMNVVQSSWACLIKRLLRGVFIAGIMICINYCFINLKENHVLKSIFIKN